MIQLNSGPEKKQTYRGHFVTIGKIRMWTFYEILSSRLNFLVMIMVFWLCKKYLLKYKKYLDRGNFLSKVSTKVKCVLNNI